MQKVHIIIHGMVDAIMYGPALFYILIFTNKYQSFKKSDCHVIAANEKGAKKGNLSVNCWA